MTNLETLKIVQDLLDEIEVNGTFVEDEENASAKFGKIYGVYHMDVGGTDKDKVKYFVFSSGLGSIFGKGRCDNEVNKLKLVKVIPHETAKVRRLKFKKGTIKGYELDHAIMVNIVDGRGE